MFHFLNRLENLLNTSVFTMNYNDVLRQWKRSFENNFKYKIIAGLLLLLIAVLFLFPAIPRRIFNKRKFSDDVKTMCLDEQLLEFESDVKDFNAYIHRDYDQMKYVPYVGNGAFGLEIRPDSSLFIKNGRSLSLPVHYHPVVTVTLPGSTSVNGTVTQYLTGKVYKFQCFDSGIFVSSEFLAHRTFPSVLIQNIRITNPTAKNVLVNIEQPVTNSFPTNIHGRTTLFDLSNNLHHVTTGLINMENDGAIAVSIISKDIQKFLQVEPFSSQTFQHVTSINYSNIIPASEYATQLNVVESYAKENMRIATLKVPAMFMHDHTKAWRELWRTGINVSYSHAAKSVNGDLINATMYYVLSQVPYGNSDLSTETANPFYTPGRCFGGHHTLEAMSLWQELNTVTQINTVVSKWLLTLDAWGCDDFLRAGAQGVVQAMVLSMGGFRFNKMHLELHIHPKHLHRDYTFRRINYGRLGYVNVTVKVEDDHRAILYVTVGDNEKYLYGCDAGCLDPPVRLSSDKMAFPVKLTDPVTSILYISDEIQYLEELRHTIHVSEVVEAPANHRHIIMMHKYGHHWGDVPPIVWLVFFLVIVPFHVCLFKIVYLESCTSMDSNRNKTGKY